MNSNLRYENISVKPLKKYKPRKVNYKDTYYIPFGKFVLDKKKLNDDNILLIKYPVSFAPVPKLRRTLISNEFKSIINDLFDTKRINTQTQKKLSIEELNIFELLLRLSGLIEVLNYKRITKSIEDYKQRFRVLQGSLNAGNDSKEVFDEVKQIVSILSKNNVISMEDAKMLLECLE
jgi:hypothetical protein